MCALLPCWGGPPWKKTRGRAEERSCSSSHGHLPIRPGDYGANDIELPFGRGNESISRSCETQDGLVLSAKPPTRRDSVLRRKEDMAHLPPSRFLPYEASSDPEPPAYEVLTTQFYPLATPIRPLPPRIALPTGGPPRERAPRSARRRGVALVGALRRRRWRSRRCRARGSAGRQLVVACRFRGKGAVADRPAPRHQRLLRQSGGPHGRRRKGGRA